MQDGRKINNIATVNFVSIGAGKVGFGSFGGGEEDEHDGTRMLDIPSILAVPGRYSL